MQRITNGTTLTVARDSSDLGLDRGMTAHVVWTDGRLMDLDVPSIDARMASVPVDHADLAVAEGSV